MYFWESSSSERNLFNVNPRLYTIQRLVRKSSHRKCSLEKKVFLEISQNSQENTCPRCLFFDKVAGLRPTTLLKKEALAQVFYFEFCEIIKNNFFTEHLLTTTSEYG